MLVEDAFIAGSLGQAVFAANGVYNIIDAAPKAESRPARDNDLFFFRHAGFDAIPAHPEGLPVTIEELNHRLIEETSLYRGLDCLLVGMDPDMSDETRILSIRGADEVLRSDAAIAARIRDRFLVPVSADEWDPESALALARDHDAGNAASCYRLLADGIVDRIVEDIARTVAEQYGAGIEASENRTLLLGCGLVAELARIEDEGDRSSASHLMFDAGRFPGMQALNRRTQILATLGKSLLERLPETEDGVSADEIADRGADAHHDPNQSADPIIVAVDRFMDADKTSDHRRNALAYVDLSAIQRQVDWIGGRLRDGRTQQAENALLELVGQQEGRSRPSDVVKTLTAVADLARRTRQFDLMRRILSAIDRTGASDGAAMVVRAYGLVDTGRLPDALAALDQTIERFPEDVVARTARAETLRDLGRLDEALAALDQTIERFPENVVARNARAETLRDLGRLDEALAALDQTIERFPENVVARTARAETLRDLGRLDEALAALDQTIERFPENVVARNARAETLRDLGRLDEALAALDQTIERFPENVVARTARAETLRDLGRLDEALAALDQTIERFPEDVVARTARAETLRDLGRLDEALAALDQTIERFPENVVARTARAETLRDLGRLDEALAALDQTIERFPEDVVARTARAETLRDLGRLDEALAALDQTIERFPENVVARTARAETLRDLGRLDEALAALDQTIERFPENVVARTARAETLRDLGRLDEALAALDQTIERFPENVVARTARAETLRDLGRLDEALAALDQTIERFPEDVVARTARAETLRDLGRLDEALAALDQTIERFPENVVARNASAHLLQMLGEFARAEKLLADAASRPTTRSDWIAKHIVAMTRLRAGRVDDALSSLEEGVANCPFRDVRPYFLTARAVARLAAKQSEDAVVETEGLAQDPALPQPLATNILLIRAHAHAEAGREQEARNLVRNPQIIDLAAARQKRLAETLARRYGLDGGEPAQGESAKDLERQILALETDLLSASRLAA